SGNPSTAALYPIHPGGPAVQRLAYNRFFWRFFSRFFWRSFWRLLRRTAGTRSAGRKTAWGLPALLLAAGALHPSLGPVAPNRRTGATAAAAAAALGGPASAGTSGEAQGDPRATPERMALLSEQLRKQVRLAPARAAAVYVEDIPTGRTAG